MEIPYSLIPEPNTVNQTLIPSPETESQIEVETIPGPSCTSLQSQTKTSNKTEKRLVSKNRKKAKFSRLTVSEIKRRYFINKLKCSTLELIYRRKQIKMINEQAKRESIIL